MLSARHETKCGIDSAGWKRPVRKRSQRTFLDQTRDVRQDLAGQFFIAMKDRIHGHDMEGCVIAKWPEWDARVLVNVAFTDLNEPTELGETRKTHRNRFPGQRD